MENLTTQIGLRMRAARKAKGMTQSEISQKTCLDQAYISHWKAARLRAARHKSWALPALSMRPSLRFTITRMRPDTQPPRQKTPLIPF
jgi:hypothetical protein